MTVNGQVDFVFRGEPTLLHAFEGHGVSLASECRAGHCGRCRLRLNVGKVRWLLEPQIPVEPGEALACCCVPAGDIVVEHDTVGLFV